MALVNCKECSAEVSDKVLNCPNCGATLRKPKRTMFGKLVKWSFIGFNILMLLWMIFGVGEAAKTIDTAASDAEKAGAAIGTVVLGLMTLLTRPKK